MLKRLRSKHQADNDNHLPEIARQAELAHNNQPSSAADLAGGKSGRLTGSLQIVLVLVLMALAIYYSRAPSTPISAGGMAADAPADVASVPTISVINPVAGAHQTQVTGNGAVGVTSFVDLVPQVSGRIAELSPSMKVGGAFSAGETLAVVEQDEFLLQLRRAKADVAVQEANLQLQQAKADAAVSNYGLINPNKPVPSLVALRPQIAQAKAQLEAARAQQDIAQLNLQRTRFTLPFDGMITVSNAQVGQLVNSGKAFGQAYAISSVELTVPISQADLSLIGPAEGREAIIVMADRRIKARINRVSPLLDSRSRFARVYIPVALSSDLSSNLSSDQPSELTPNQGTVERSIGLKPGMFADVTIQGPTHQNSLLLPESALQANGELWFVRSGTLQRHQPQILGRNNKGIVIQGFDLGEGIVVGGVAGAFDGMAVAATPSLVRDA